MARAGRRLRLKPYWFNGIERAQQTQKLCQVDHGPAEHGYDRIKQESP